MESYVGLFIRAAFVENLALAFFLGVGLVQRLGNDGS